MSTKNIELKSGRDAASRTAGTTYDGKEIYRVGPSLHETYTTKYFTPVQGSPSSVHTLTLDWGISDEYNLNGLFLEFTQQNKHATASQTILNPYLLFSEFKVLINQQELIAHDNQESIFLTVAHFFRKMRDDRRTSYLSTIFPTQSSSPLSGEAVAASSSVNWSLPLEPLLSMIKNISRSDGVSRLTIEFKFEKNYGTASSNGRFIRSSENVNVYTDSTISFNNIAVRLATTKHSDPVLRNVPNATVLLNKYDVKTYPGLNWSTGGELQRVQLSTEFSIHPIVHGIWLYMYNVAGVTAYNDVDCCKVESRVSAIGWELKFKSKTIAKYDTPLQANQRRRYLHDSYERKHANPYPVALCQETDDLCQVWIPPTFIDLSSTALHKEDADVVAGLPSNSDIELIVYNAKSNGNIGSNVSLVVALCYAERCDISSSTGQLVFYK